MKALFADMDTRSICNLDIIENKMLAQLRTSRKPKVHALPKLCICYNAGMFKSFF